MIKRNDLLLILGLVLVIAAMCVVRNFIMDGSPSDYVEIRIDGELIAEYSLDEDREEIFMSEDGGMNKLVIREGTASITEADCPDKHCVHKGAVSEINETIICLPHKLVVKLCGESENMPDIMAE